jgi:hypothetical protein
MGGVYVSGCGPAWAGSEQGSVGGLQLGPRRLAAQHGELVAQDEDLQVLGGVVMGDSGQELDGAAQRQVGESWQHLGGGLRDGIRGTSQYRPYRPNPQASDQSEFLSPRGRPRKRPAKVAGDKGYAYPSATADTAVCTAVPCIC